MGWGTGAGLGFRGGTLRATGKSGILLLAESGAIGGGAIHPFPDVPQEASGPVGDPGQCCLVGRRVPRPRLGLHTLAAWLPKPSPEDDSTQSRTCLRARPRTDPGGALGLCLSLEECSEPVTEAARNAFPWAARCPFHLPRASWGLSGIILVKVGRA